MLAMLATIGRVLAAHWPALVALHLAGVLVRYGVIELAGWVGAFTAVGGLLLLPLAVLARLAAFVGMFLVVRDGLRELRAVAPPPVEPRERRRALLGALLAGILPFFATYWAMGDLREDWNAYITRALEVQTELRWIALDAGGEVESAGTLDDVQLGPLTIGLVVVAFAGRWAWKRWGARLPRWLAIVAVYLEAVWVFLSVTLVDEVLGGVRGWVDSRQASTWLADGRAWLAQHVEPLSWAWDGLDWTLAQAGGVLGPPLAWLAIAGVLYGQAVAAQSPRMPDRVAALVASRTRGVPVWLQAQGRQLGEVAAGRVLPLWRAVVLMWRAGPVLIGASALLYAAVEALGTSLAWGLTRVVGPHPIDEGWRVWGAAVLLPVALVVEVLRVAVVAGAYDATVGRLRARTADAVRAAVGPEVPDAAADAAADLAARDAVAGVADARATDPVALAEAATAAAAMPGPGAAAVPGSGPVEVQAGQLGAVDRQLDVEGEGPGAVGHREPREE